MMIHTNTITYNAIQDMLHGMPGVSFERCDEKGSRSHARKFDVILTGNSTHRGNFGRDAQAATWDEWGMFIERVFQADPTAVVGPYLDHEHFRWITCARFDTLKPADQHIRHKWGYGARNVTGTYSVRECPCGAGERWLLHTTWAEFKAWV